MIKRERFLPFLIVFILEPAGMKKLTLLFLVLLMGCNGGVVDRLLKKQSPYEDYLSSLESTILGNYALVQDWKRAGETVLQDSLIIDLPYHEIGYFDPTEPRAMLLRYPVEEGSQINVALEPVSQKDARFFLDIFELDPVDSLLEEIHHADSLGTISYQVKNTGIHALRLQPELFRGGVFSLSIVSQGTLAFPIAEKSTRNIASFWGDPRDGDARKHEGVDIFAPRGTPVVAASSGRIRRVGDNRLGGKVVWLHDNRLGHSQYYAHLDSQLVTAGQVVSIGDTLGLVGNSGNAITTSPHLHFGIYRSGRGAVDPFPFLKEVELPDTTAVSDSTYLGTFARINVPRANVRRAPSPSSENLGSFTINSYVQVHGKSGEWYRISLPDQQEGFIYASLIAIADTPIRELQINPIDEVWEFWHSSHPISGDLISGRAKVWAEFDDAFYVETLNGIKGWWKPVR